MHPASLLPRTPVRPSACRSLCALISPRSTGSYAEEVTVGGKPAGHGSGRVQRGRRADKSWRQSGQTPHQGIPQPWQLAPSSRSPAAATQTRSPEGEKLTGRFWSPDSGLARAAAESVDRRGT